MAAQPILSQVTVEIRFGRGMVYLDRCGSLYTRMADELGTAFVAPDVPTVESTDFSSLEERLSVRFGPRNLVVGQQWVSNPARVEQIAVKAWTIVSEALDVKSQVHRTGMRFFLQWRVETVEEGNMRALRINEPSEKWRSLFGAPTGASYVGVEERPDGSGRRAELSVVQQSARALSASLADKVAPQAIQLDLDYVLEGPSRPFGTTRLVGKPRGLGPGQLKDFMRESWQRTQTSAKALEEAWGQP